MSFEDAAFQYATEHEKEGLRNLETEHGFDARLALMRAGLFDRLYAEELLAVGIPVLKETAPILEVVPSLYFFDSSNTAVRNALSGEAGRLRLSGREWAQVRIIKNDIAKEHDFPQKRPRGRPSVGGALNEIVAALHSEGQLEGLSRKEQENAVRMRARSLHRNLFPRETQPSRQKILDALAKHFQKQSLTKSKKYKKSN